MEAIAVNTLIGIVSLLFGAMAVFPMLVESKPARKTPMIVDDDQVISVQPMAPASTGLRSVPMIGSEAERDPSQRRAA